MPEPGRDPLATGFWSLLIYVVFPILAEHSGTLLFVAGLLCGASLTLYLTG